MLRVWGRKSSSNVQPVMWCLAELRLAVERYDVGHTFGGNDTPDFLAMNPTGRIPVLRDGDDPPLWESAAIIRYLANRYGEPQFWPRDLSARAQIDKWAEWAKINVAVSFASLVFIPLVRAPARDRDEAAVARGAKVVGQHLAIADAQLERHAFLAGEMLTPADIMLGHVLFRYFDVPIERPDLPNLRRYYADLCRRPAYAEHVMIGYEELRGT